MKGDMCLKWLEKASPQAPDLKKFAELSGAAAHGTHHFTRILDTGMKDDICLELLEKASPQTEN